MRNGKYLQVFNAKFHRKVFFQSWPKTFVAFSHSTTFEKLQNQVIRKHIGSHENVGRKVYFHLVLSRSSQIDEALPTIMYVINAQYLNAK